MILTITTDFSSFAASTGLSCRLVSTEGTVVLEKEVQWQEYDREVKINLSVPRNFREGRVVVSPCGSVPGSNDGGFLRSFLGRDVPHLVGVETETFSIDNLLRQETVYRNFVLRGHPLRIAEQTGETIIRHVWDAGIILSAALTYHPPSALPEELNAFNSSVISTSTRIKVLEVGCGVGILGISIAAAFPQSQVVMTDLSDAQSLVEQNIKLNLRGYPHLKRNANFRSLDWETRPYPEWTTAEHFDLIVMADVTYNTATFLALADTLEHLLRSGSKGSRVICCGKRRHDEEEGFWRLVKERGFIVERRVIFSMDLDGHFGLCMNGIEQDGEQLIDFISMHL